MGGGPVQAGSGRPERVRTQAGDPAFQPLEMWARGVAQPVIGQPCIEHMSPMTEHDAQPCADRSGR